MKTQNLLKLLGLIGLCEIVGFASSLFMGNSVSTWYSTLNKPAWTPPNWLFAPVWITLYALMGASLFFVVKSKSDTKKFGIALFSVQLFLNFYWSVLFFGSSHNIGLALFDIFLLWVALLAAILVFWKISKKASILLVPYLIWVSIAMYLNFSVFILNQIAYI